MAQDLSFLAALPVDRHVTNVAVAGNQGQHGGCLLKFAMRNGTTETVLLISGPAKASYMNLKEAQRLGCLPPLAQEVQDALVAALPTVEEYDWNMHHESGRIVAVVKMFFDLQGIGCEFVMQNGDLRRFWLPTKVARFLGEYLAVYKATFEGHQDEDPDEPIVY